ncbi:MAG: putative endonuclease [Psychroserpens sp.]|jgi:putative endonuclease
MRENSKLWCVYIMTNKKEGVLYIGCTDHIIERVKEHKFIKYPRAFTAKYKCNLLVYFEEFEDGEEASIREIQFKKWERDWKIKLIEDMNPSWMDLSMNWNLGLNKFRD